MSQHDNGIAVLGATPDRCITIRLIDPKALARAEGGLAKMAADWIPDLTTAKVYEEAASQIRQSLAAKNVRATVAVSDGSGSALTSEQEKSEAALITTGAVLGAVTVGIGYFATKLLFRR